MSVVTDYKTGKITMDTLNDELPGSFHPSFFRFIGATTAGHKVILKDQAEERVVFESEANGANFTDIQPYVKKTAINGFKLTTIGSGKVEIHLR
jgi:hypothetical protein